MNNLKFFGNVSWSAINLYRNCQRNFYYSKISKTKASNKIEEKYGKFGNAVHEMLEKDLDVNEIYSKFNLSEYEYRIDDLKELYENGKSFEFDFKYRERKLKLNYKGLNFVAIIDFELKDKSIGDWKTSTFSPKKKSDYEQQLLFYSWFIYKLENRIVPECNLIFLKDKKNFTFKPTLEKIEQFEKDVILKNIEDLNKKTKFEDFELNLKSCFFCPYKSKCTQDSFIKNNFSVDINIYNNYIKISEIKDKLFYEVVEKELSYELDNAHFIKKAMLAKGIKNYDTNVKLFKNNMCSIGFLSKIKQLLKEFAEHRKLNLFINEIDNRTFNREKINVSNNSRQLRKYQEKAVDKILEDKISITEICTGAGKTTIAAEIISRLKYKTLFVVDRNILLEQTKKDFETCIENIKIGTITEGKIIEGDIYIGSIQTIIKKLKDEQFKKFVKEFNVVIIDEAHGAKSKSYQELMKQVIAEYRIALTGTAYSDGNNSLELYKSFGFPDFKIRAIDLINEGYLVKPTIRFITYNEGFITNGIFNEIYEQVLKSDDRLETLKVVAEINKTKNILIMVDRIEHILIIKEFLEVDVISGATSKKERERIIEKIKTSKANILIATSSIIQKGVDIPTLDVIINYSANLGSIKTIQSLGRILRKSEGKTEAFYYDFYDEHKKLYSHTKARIKALEEQGYEVLKI